MSRARVGKLTDAYVESLKPKPGGRERIIRDGGVPGFLVRVGPRKRSFELRIEQLPKITRQLGHWHDVRAGEARRAAEDIWAKHRLGEPLNGGARKGGETVASTWPLFKARLTDDGRSQRTIDGYEDVFQRLSDDVKQRPLLELGVAPPSWKARSPESVSCFEISRAVGAPWQQPPPASSPRSSILRSDAIRCFPGTR